VPASSVESPGAQPSCGDARADKTFGMAFVQFSGVTYHEPDQVYESHVLYTAADGVTRLIDLDGAVRHAWPLPGVPARIIDPALNGGRIGDVGVQLTQVEGSPGGIYGNRTVGQLSWTGRSSGSGGPKHLAVRRARTTIGNCSQEAIDSSWSQSRAKCRIWVHTSSAIRDSTKSRRTGRSCGGGGLARVRPRPRRCAVPRRRRRRSRRRCCRTRTTVAPWPPGPFAAGSAGRNGVPPALRCLRR
jgi:hypothetical protein